MSDWIKWVLWIDLEGYSYIHRQDSTSANWLLHNLQKDLNKLGTEIIPDRLFIHQVGDGFILRGDFCDKTLERPLSIAIALMKSSLLQGACLKIAIGIGELYDVQGLYPEEIRGKQELGCLRIGNGVMTLHTVMGDGLVDSHDYSKCGKGPLLIVRGNLEYALPYEELIFLKYEKHIEVDWIHSKAGFAKNICEKLGVSATSLEGS